MKKYIVTTEVSGPIGLTMIVHASTEEEASKIAGDKFREFNQSQWEVEVLEQPQMGIGWDVMEAPQKII